MNDEKKEEQPTNDTDYRPHWKGSHYQHVRTLIFAAVAIISFLVYIVYYYGARIYSIPPPPS